MLHLGRPDDVPALGMPVEHCDGHRGYLALAVARQQLAGDTGALVFDHVGPARIQTLLPRPARAPFAIYVHGIEAWGAQGWQRRRALALADALLVNSRYTARRAGLAMGKVRLMPPLDEEEPEGGAPDARVLADVGSGYALMVGRMSSSERYKGHDLVLQALATLVSSRRVAAKLAVAGGGDDRHRLEQVARELGIGHAVVFLGFVSRPTLAALYRGARLLAMPSRDEGFGIAYLEAMRAGIPCIALRGSAAEDLVADGETGLLVDEGDVAGLAAALERLLGDEDLSRRLGQAGAQRARSLLASSRFSRDFEEVVDRLLGVRGSREGAA